MNLAILQDFAGNLLAGDQGVTDALGSHAGRVQGGTTPNGPYPYLAIGEDEMNDASVQFLEAGTVRMKVHVWTKEEGFSACKAIEAALRKALTADGAFDAIVGLRVVSCDFWTNRFFKDPKHGIRHGVSEYDVEIEAIA